MHHPAITDASVSVARRDLVEDVLRALDPDGRAIVVLHYYLGMPLPEVAATLRIPVGTVKSRLHRALGEMRDELGVGRPAVATSVSGGTVA